MGAISAGLRELARPVSLLGAWHRSQAAARTEAIRNLSDAQAAEIADRITSRQVGISPECGGYCASGFCASNDSSTCPDSYCGSGYCEDSYCTSKSPNSCWPYFSSSEYGC